MDIIKPQSIDFDALGGKLARQWGSCYANGDEQVKNYETIIMPYVSSVIEPMFNTVEHTPQWPALDSMKPVTYVIGGSSDDWEVVNSTLEESYKTQGTKKEFEKNKREGNIVLKPMLNCKIFGSAYPKIYSPTEPVAAPMQYSYLNMGGLRGGVCRSNWTAFPMLSCDSFASGVQVKRKLYRNATTIPVPKDVLDRVMREVKRKLDGIEPDRGLVTQVVSEANSASWDIATEIMEAPETIKYILNGIKQGILLLLRAKRDIKQNLSKGAVTDIASIWMQYRYALMPIVYGVNDALDVLGMDAVKFQSFRGRTDAPLINETEFEGFTVKSSPTINNRVFLKYKYDVDSSIHHGLKINLAATAWELLPLSFVFDWFFQVGDYLTAAFKPGVVDQHGCQQSVRCKGSLILEGNSSEVLKLDVDYYRTRIIQPNAFIGINSDLFISFNRAMDALALSWLLFGKKNGRG